MKSNFLKTLGFLGIVTAYWVMGVATSQENPYIEVELQLDVTQVDSVLVIANNDTQNYSFDSFVINYAVDSTNNLSLPYTLSNYELSAGITDSILVWNFKNSNDEPFPIDSSIYVVQIQALVGPDTGGSYYKEF